MPPALVPCPQCLRHVRATEASCPFCRNALPESPRIIPGATQRLTRAAAYAFTATLAASGAAVAVTACSGGPDNPTPDQGGQQPVYGAPEYGAPPVDASAKDSNTGDDAQGQALYGAPAYGAQPFDAGSD